MSRFEGIFKNAKRPPTPDETPTDPPPSSAKVPEIVPEAPAAPPAPPSPAPRMGRPKGKRSDPAYEQVSAYIPRELYRKVRIALLEDDRAHEFSELTAELLSAWLVGRQSG